MATLITTVSLAGCAPEPGDDWDTEYELVWTADARLLSDPFIADDVVLAYVATGKGEEEVVAWDIETGKQLWSTRSLPGRDARGLQHRIAAIEKDDGWQVSMLVPEFSNSPVDTWSLPDVVDARTGASLVENLYETGIWSDRPYACGADEDRFCFEGIVSPTVENKFDAVREYDADDRDFFVHDGPGSGYHAGGVSVGDRLTVDEANQLNYGEDGERMWSRSYEELFGATASTAAGWSWYDFDDRSTPLMGLGYLYEDPELNDEPKTLKRELGTGRVVRLDRKTGETLWTVDAEECPMSDDWRKQNDDDLVVLCRYDRGTISAKWDGKDVTDLRYSDVSIDVIGVDINTGETRWTMPIGDGGLRGDDEDAATRGSSYASDADHLIADIDGVLNIIDTASGAVRPVPEDEHVLCAPEQDEVTLTSIWEDPTYYLAETYALCGPDNVIDPEAVPTVAALTIAGYDLDEPVIMNTPEGLRRYAPVEP